MAMRTLRWMVLALSTVWALQPKELEEWFASSSGLAMSPSDAQQEATRSWSTLAKCGVEISTLQALRDALHDSSSLDLSLEVIRKQIIELAEQHIKADKLKLGCVPSPCHVGLVDLIISNAFVVFIGFQFQQTGDKVT